MKEMLRMYDYCKISYESLNSRKGPRNAVDLSIDVTTLVSQCSEWVRILHCINSKVLFPL